LYNSFLVDKIIVHYIKKAIVAKAFAMKATRLKFGHKEAAVSYCKLTSYEYRLLSSQSTDVLLMEISMA